MKHVVFMHGFGEDDSIWTDFIKLLPSDYTYFCPQYANLKSCFSITEYSEWLKKELDKKGIEEMVIIGHSMGGYISLEFAEMFPNRILGLGLFHSTAAPDSESKKEARDKNIQFLIKHDTQLFIKHFYPNMFNEDFQKIHGTLINSNIERFSQIPNEALLAATIAMKGRKGQLEEIKEWEFPVMQILGSQDTFVNHKDALLQTASLKNPYTLLLASISHAGMYEEPQVCADFTTRFLKEVFKTN